MVSANPPHEPRPEPIDTALRRWSGGGLAGMLAATAAIVLWRRAAGALATPLDALSLAILAGLAAARAAALALAVSLPGAPTAGLLSLWGPLILAGAWTLAPPSARFRSRNRPWWPKTFPRAPVAAHRLAPGPRAGKGLGLGPLFPAAPEGWTEEATQQFVRYASGDGEVVTARLRADFAPGQRTASLHVAFCPPFLHTPMLTVRQAAGPPCTFKTVLLLPYGARIDARLTQPLDVAHHAVIDLTARAASGQG